MVTPWQSSGRSRYRSSSSATKTVFGARMRSLRPGLGAHGEGATEDEALDDLRVALTGLIDEFGVPREMSVTVAA